MFYKDFTPLLGPADQIRVARPYPGGRNLDRLIGPKKNSEAGWFYPEAWVFSPEPAVNPGSQRPRDGQTLVFDEKGNSFSWYDFIEHNGQEVLAGQELRITVKLLDSDSTLAKEFHFRESDQDKLRSLDSMKDFRGTFIKPEIWIRHPEASYKATESFVGFTNFFADSRELKELVAQGPRVMEAHMNSVVIAPGSGLFIPGGIVHSLGKGFYFEVLADGDMRVLLQDSFMDKKFSPEEQFGPLCTRKGDDIDKALEFVDSSSYGQELIKRCKSVPRQLGEFKEVIVTTPYFSAEWIRIPPGRRFETENSSPHILVAVSGKGRIVSEDSCIRLLAIPSDFATFSQEKTCNAVIVHATTSWYALENNGDIPSIVLAAYGGDVLGKGKEGTNV